MLQFSICSHFERVPSAKGAMSHLVPVGLIEDRSCEDDDIEDDAETVEEREGGDKPEEAGLEVERGRRDDTEGHQVS